MRNGRGEAFERSVEIMTPLPVPVRTGKKTYRYSTGTECRARSSFSSSCWLYQVAGGSRHAPRSTSPGSSTVYA